MQLISTGLGLMTIEQFSRQTYLYPILWYLGATIVAFIAAILFWKRGSATASGSIPGVSATWKFTGACYPDRFQSACCAGTNHFQLGWRGKSKEYNRG